MEKHVSVGDEDKVGDIEGGVMDGAIDGDKDRLMLGDRDEDGVWLIDGTAEGAAGKNGRENLVASLNPKFPPSAINAPFDVTM
mmetsp:Transcript_2073/g.3267  ORF Transcript_2073/g.3267 Transcript_2073/m.3267 type:complete len:83 (+) Transcript_2073:438-686(+)